jgi:hypothetical protein
MMQYSILTQKFRLHHLSSLLLLPLNLNGPEINLNGSAKTIYEQIVANNPNYDFELGNKRHNALDKRQQDPIDWNVSYTPSLCQ